MRVFLIAAVLAVFATPAAARCSLDGAASFFREKGMSGPACSCIWQEVADAMQLYFATAHRPGVPMSKPGDINHQALDRANKLANIHAKMCRINWKSPHRPD